MGFLEEKYVQDMDYYQLTGTQIYCLEIDQNVIKSDLRGRCVDSLKNKQIFSYLTA